MSRDVAIVAVLVAGVAACNAIFGVDDLSVVEGQGGDGGANDGGAPSTECFANEVMPCYEGPEATAGLGSCHSGTQTCKEDGSGYEPCVNQQLPTLEDCSSDSEDLDCNGLSCLGPVWIDTVSDASPNIEDQAVVAVASDDNTVVITGRYVEALTIGAFPLPYYEPSDNSESGFVIKLSEKGDIIWLIDLAGPDFQAPSAVTLDQSGNVIVAGTFRSELAVTWNDGTETITNATDNTSGTAAFIVKIDAEGRHVWTKSFSGDGDTTATAIAVDDAGRIAVTGALTMSAMFDAVLVPGNSTENGFVAMLDPGGAVEWVKSHPSAGTNVTTSIALSDGRVHVGGGLLGTLDLETTMLSSESGPDGLILTYDAKGGTLLAHRQLPGTGNKNVTGLAMVGDDVVACGYFTGTIDLGDGGYQTATGTDIFVARYSAGTDSLVWGTSLSNVGDARPNALAVDSHDEIALVGWFTQALSWSPVAQSSQGMKDAFIAKMTGTGEVRFATTFGDTSDDEATAISVHPSTRDILAGGIFTGELSLGTEVYAAQAEDGFIIRLGP